VFRRDFLMTPCASAKEALAALRHDNFDVIIADQSMPELSGVELLRLVVVAAPQMRRAMCTGYPDLPEVIEAQRSGLAQIVIMKPWNADEVRRWIHHLVKLGTMHDAVAKLRQSVDGPERK